MVNAPASKENAHLYTRPNGGQLRATSGATVMMNDGRHVRKTKGFSVFFYEKT